MASSAMLKMLNRLDFVRPFHFEITRNNNNNNGRIRKCKKYMQIKVRDDKSDCCD